MKNNLENFKDQDDAQQKLVQEKTRSCANIRIKDQKEDEEGTISIGSGFLQKQGSIITAAHVIENGLEQMGDKPQIFQVQILGNVQQGKHTKINKRKDIGVIKLFKESLDRLEEDKSEKSPTKSPKNIEDDYADLKNIRKTDPIFVMGYPEACQFVVVGGSICNENYTPQTSENKDDSKLILIQASIAEGNSGSPVFNKQGKLIGFVTRKYILNPNIALVIPFYSISGYLQRILEEIDTPSLPEEVDIVMLNNDTENDKCFGLNSFQEVTNSINLNLKNTLLNPNITQKEIEVQNSGHKDFIATIPNKIYEQQYAKSNISHSIISDEIYERSVIHAFDFIVIKFNKQSPQKRIEDMNFYIFHLENQFNTCSDLQPKVIVKDFIVRASDYFSQEPCVNKESKRFILAEKGQIFFQNRINEQRSAKF